MDGGENGADDTWFATKKGVPEGGFKSASPVVPGCYTRLPIHTTRPTT